VELGAVLEIMGFANKETASVLPSPCTSGVRCGQNINGCKGTITVDICPALAFFARLFCQELI
jgi:hypothetical protein